MKRWGRAGSGAEGARSRTRSRELRVDKIALDAMDIDPVALLAQAAYLQLAQFTALSKAASDAADVESKSALAAAAGHLLGKHRALLAALERRGVDPSAAMLPYVPSSDEFFEMAAGANWFEALTSCYLVGGLLDDFFARLVSGLDPEGADLEHVLRGPRGVEELIGILSRAVDDDPRLASRLAVWGRRLVGDTLLIARSALPETVRTPTGEARVEPVLTDLMAEHTRRMDRLGLTA